MSPRWGDAAAQVFSMRVKLCLKPTSNHPRHSSTIYLENFGPPLTARIILSARQEAEPNKPTITSNHLKKTTSQPLLPGMWEINTGLDKWSRLAVFSLLYCLQEAWDGERKYLSSFSALVSALQAIYNQVSPFHVTLHILLSSFQPYMLIDMYNQSAKLLSCFVCLSIQIMPENLRIRSQGQVLSKESSLSYKLLEVAEKHQYPISTICNVYTSIIDTDDVVMVTRSNEHVSFSNLLMYF